MICNICGGEISVNGRKWHNKSEYNIKCSSSKCNRITYHYGIVCSQSGVYYIPKGADVLRKAGYEKKVFDARWRTLSKTFSIKPSECKALALSGDFFIEMMCAAVKSKSVI